MAKFNTMDAPIPGANFLSDTKNYPWHRPPKVSDYDDGVQLVARRILNKERAGKLLTLMEVGMPISAICNTLIMVGISKGDFTPDFGIILAGPMAHLLKMLAEEFEIDYEMGIEYDVPKPTGTFYTGIQQLKSNPDSIEAKLPKGMEPQVEEVIEEEPVETGSFMEGI